MLFAIIFILILLAVLDASFASLIISLGIYVFGTIVVLIYQKGSRKKTLLLYNVVFLMYLVLAFGVSVSFSATDYFFVSDPSRYIDNYLNSTYQFWQKEAFIRCYLEYSDNNALYNAFLNFIAVFVNRTIGGLTVYSLTLCHTIWGVLSSIVLFQILVRRLDENKAFQIALIFASCSLFLFYSTVIIRDIIICFFYLVAFDIIDQKFTFIGVIKLVLVVFVVWGIRLYSGLFAITFLCYYIYVRMYNSTFRPIATIVFAIVLIGTSGSILASDIVGQTIEEMQSYSELTTERSAGGIVSKLQSLPLGISHFTVVLFTMIRPLPPLGIYIGAETFSHILISTMVLVAGFFWFVVFYSLCYQLFVKKYISKIPFEKIILLLVCLVFMLANASHPDIRRMLPVFPILFVQFAEICQAENTALLGNKISKRLVIFYIIMAFAMYAIY